jgi:hypothetical protein
MSCQSEANGDASNKSRNGDFALYEIAWGDCSLKKENNGD